MGLEFWNWTGLRRVKDIKDYFFKVFLVDEKLSMGLFDYFFDTLLWYELRPTLELGLRLS